MSSFTKRSPSGTTNGAMSIKIMGGSGDDVIHFGRVNGIVRPTDDNGTQPNRLYVPMTASISPIRGIGDGPTAVSMSQI